MVEGSGGLGGEGNDGGFSGVDGGGQFSEGDEENVFCMEYDGLRKGSDSIGRGMGWAVGYLSGLGLALGAW